MQHSDNDNTVIEGTVKNAASAIGQGAQSLAYMVAWRACKIHLCNPLDLSRNISYKIGGSFHAILSNIIENAIEVAIGFSR